MTKRSAYRARPVVDTFNHASANGTRERVVQVVETVEQATFERFRLLWNWVCLVTLEHWLSRY
ncbi:hypothetical protein [Paraburkholderia kirstenboschensis]|jgi:hypothetical protein|uniref:Transposase n=1 Tax=Paraburkholderia kirstenboschensis TaxID=1245436 RepID=A0ABZ0EEQ8_9BURK|nr:hypothetical protein [Paraburkholderia kirstenboschensis]WOD15035.1 hypothetical protein RW095_17010 [Paraburkholderia kirstenboschensis]